MSVKARLRQIEKAAGVGELCLNCKRHLILYSDIITRTKPEDVFSFPCDTCGFLYYEILDGYSELERGLVRELCLSLRSERRTLEKRKRFYALQLYYWILPRTRELRKKGEDEEARLRALEKPPASVRSQLKVLDEWNALSAERKETRLRKRTEAEDEERESRRALAAPTMAVIHAVKAEQIADEDLHYLKIMAGLEAIIFGATLPETLGKVEAREAALLAEKEARERERREQEEQRERERLEREEKWAREREEREQERLRRMGASPDAPTPRRTVFMTSDVEIPQEVVNPRPPRPWETAEVKPQPPPNDGRDPHYHLRMAHFKLTGVWPPDSWLER
jgi:hypothetical protein